MRGRGEEPRGGKGALRKCGFREPSAGVSSRKEIKMRAEKRCLSSATGGQFTSHPEWLVHCDSGKDVTVLEAVRRGVRLEPGAVCL